MRERKSQPPCPKPTCESGYVCKDELDDHLDIHLPVPTRTVSNQEFVPIEQTRRYPRRIKKAQPVVGLWNRGRLSLVAPW